MALQGSAEYRNISCIPSVMLFDTIGHRPSGYWDLSRHPLIMRVSECVHVCVFLMIAFFMRPSDRHPHALYDQFLVMFGMHNDGPRPATGMTTSRYRLSIFLPYHPWHLRIVSPPCSGMWRNPIKL